MIEITVNAKLKQIEENTTLDSLLDELNIKDQVMAAAINMQIVKQESWKTHILKSEDKLELLDFVGGG